MGVLEQVTAFKGKGLSDQDITRKLKEQGISPKEINNALSQAKIKEAVSSEGNQGGTPSMMGPEEGETLPTEGSISDEDLMPPPSPSGFQARQKKLGPMHKEVSEGQGGYGAAGRGEYVPQPMPQSQVQEQGEYPQYPYQQQYGGGNYPQEYAGGYEGYGADYSGYAQGAGDTDTMIEIAEQVFSEKTKTIQKQLEDLNEFKVLMQTKIDNLSDRLKRIESNIDSLQAEILEKVGSYGRGIESVKKEMSMMQESFGKVVNTLADKAEGKKHKHPTHHKIEKKVIVTHKSSKKKKRSKKKK